MGEFDDEILDMLETQDEYEKVCAHEPMNKKIDPVNPDHYKNSTSLECIEAMEIVLGANTVICFCVGNAWKYIWRWKNKNGAEDLKKAKWYIEKAWDLIDSEFVPYARSRFSDILTRMNDYIDRVERKLNKEKKNED